MVVFGDTNHATSITKILVKVNMRVALIAGLDPTPYDTSMTVIHIIIIGLAIKKTLECHPLPCHANFLSCGLLDACACMVTYGLQVALNAKCMILCIINISTREKLQSKSRKTWIYLLRKLSFCYRV